MRQSLRINQYIFQSTLSMRRATAMSWVTPWRDSISIHALHEESDSIGIQGEKTVKFQSTLSMRRATR